MVEQWIELFYHQFADQNDINSEDVELNLFDYLDVKN
jgi:hypothetical protein